MNSLVLGIDPGLARTGWAVVEYKNPSEMCYIASGVISTNAREELSKRIRKIHEGVTEVIDNFDPNVSVLEKIFVNSNPCSSLKLAYCRGALMLTLALKSLPVLEIAPNAIKKRITGSGHATKLQIRYMVEKLLGLNLNLSKYSDLYDALALASSVTHYDITAVQRA
ncbi:crossover junction endodeoxyribonuclease RuvC [Neorickettsia helminthoeca str. Oregon]|uniref:Crossover junction endodeoxyribonuclease RuvC n=1 Tax=Neorickettsia helminthoeca str. Oregon TaxID=1286528 RepID=X5HL46_9RICK|nr:crossover junction endodeoxyribonuclease RuvC [Neorickettsia helminthoeca]AHX11829.1 crossover junction endodeoxyribonuclease RuvC [Neorickettsia helminthoeca str. Oregon]